jgi:flagellin
LSASSWGGTSADYSAGYVATKYLDDKLRLAGHAGGLKDAMVALQANPTWDMDDVVAMAGYADQAAFLTDVKANGAAWMGGWTAGRITVGDADVGSIAGSSYGGPSMNSAASVANGPAVMPADWTPWTESWPSTTAAGAQVTLQIGANYGQTLMLNTVSATSGSLGVGNVDLVGSAQSAISQIDAAIAKVSSYRSAFGADQNRLEHTLANLGVATENQAAAQSRIRDTDMADEMSTFTRRQIMSESATAMLAQANAKPAMLMSLLLA